MEQEKTKAKEKKKEMGKRGPKPKSEEEKRKHPVTCRLTDREMEQLDKGKPENMTRGEWLRTKALKRKLPRSIPEINRQAYTNLARLAGNLNQYIKAINQGRATGPAPELNFLYDEVQKLRGQLIGLKDESED
jgi:hypothetical protein